jgi:hypothetical protein
MGQQLHYIRSTTTPSSATQAQRSQRREELQDLSFPFLLLQRGGLATSVDPRRARPEVVCSVFLLILAAATSTLSALTMVLHPSNHLRVRFALSSFLTVVSWHDSNVLCSFYGSNPMARLWRCAIVSSVDLSAVDDCPGAWSSRLLCWCQFQVFQHRRGPHYCIPVTKSRKQMNCKQANWQGPLAAVECKCSNHQFLPSISHTIFYCYFTYEFVFICCCRKMMLLIRVKVSYYLFLQLFLFDF